MAILIVLALAVCSEQLVAGLRLAPPMPKCGMDSLTQTPVSGTWVKDGNLSSRSYSPFCPFLENRYRCLDKKTSANLWTFQVNTEQTCQMPTLDESFSALGGKRMLMCGDSHMQQIFQEMLCRFEESLLHLNTADAPFTLVVQSYLGQLKNFFSSEVLRQWAEHVSAKHGIPIDDSDMDRWLNKIAEKKAGRIRSTPYGKHIGFHVAKFMNGLELWFVYLRGDYPDGDPNIEEKCLEVASRINLETEEIDFEPAVKNKKRSDPLHLFDHIISNDYVNMKNMMMSLAERKFAKKFLQIPKWTFGRFGMGGPEPVNVSHQLAVQRAPPAPFRAAYLDMRDLVRSREGDSHASIYPLTYISSGKPKDCCHGPICRTFDECATHEWHISNEAASAELETHFCQPGPLDSFLSLVLASAAFE